MDVGNAAGVLAGSILTCLAIIVMVITVVIINNIFSRYWKPVKWIKFEDTPRFITPEELEQHKVETK